MVGLARCGVGAMMESWERRQVGVGNGYAGERATDETGVSEQPRDGWLAERLANHIDLAELDGMYGRTHR